MIIVPNKNLYLPERMWPSKKAQRGSIILAHQTPAGIDYDCKAGLTTNYGANDTQAEPTTTEASVRYGTDGVRQKYEDNNNVYAGTGKYIGDCAASDYDHSWTNVSGTDGSLTLAENTWAQCSVTALSLSLSEQDEGSYVRVVTVKLRRRSDSFQVSAIQVTVSLTVQPP